MAAARTLTAADGGGAERARAAAVLAALYSARSTALSPAESAAVAHLCAGIRAPLLESATPAAARAGCALACLALRDGGGGVEVVATAECALSVCARALAPPAAAAAAGRQGQAEGLRARESETDRERTPLIGRVGPFTFEL
ncbi:hypothetical protein T492DRAFT_847558 [Pavlovales sp. CCMP2436]|nr:hypothetical protein T492DRAFT_847558 [Pavlovales sp. CCMP2436]